MIGFDTDNGINAIGTFWETSIGRKIRSGWQSGKLWTLLIGAALFLSLYRESGVFSLLEGSIGVRLTSAFGTGIFSPPQKDVALGAAIGTSVVVCAVALCYFGYIKWPVAALFSLLACVGMWMQASVWRSWASPVSKALSECEILVAGANVDAAEVLSEVSEVGSGCWVSHGDGKVLLAVYPRWHHRVDEALESLRKKGYTASLRPHTGPRLWVRDTEEGTSTAPSEEHAPAASQPTSAGQARSDSRGWGCITTSGDRTWRATASMP